MGELGLMGHVIADYPGPGEVRAMIQVMAEAGVKIIEIQIPFSEPMADGPLFLAANHAALRAGVDYAKSRRLMAEASARHPDVTFMFMTYLNVVYKRGYQAFAEDAAKVGARGLIVPDLAFDQADELERCLGNVGLSNVRIAAPNTDPERLQRLAAGARGLIYAVARRGVTGATTAFDTSVLDFVKRLKAVTRVPVAVGFGVRTPDDVAALRGHADYAIVGTASLEAFKRGGIAGFKTFWQDLAEAAG